MEISSQLSHKINLKLLLKTQFYKSLNHRQTKTIKNKPTKTARKYEIDLETLLNKSEYSIFPTKAITADKILNIKKYTKQTRIGFKTINTKTKIPHAPKAFLITIAHE